MLVIYYLILLSIMMEKTNAAPFQDILIHDGIYITVEGRFKKDIRIRNGKIIELGEDLAHSGEQERIINAKGLLILPGGIDPHVHLTLPKSVPDNDRWVDDLTSGSMAALAGGITTIGNMCFPEIIETPLATIEREIQLVQTQAICDVFLHPVIMEPELSVISEFQTMVDQGHTTIKIFMVMEHYKSNRKAFKEIIRAAGRAGLLTMLHCEDNDLIAAATQHLISRGKRSLRYYAESRPVASEVEATRDAVTMCEETSAPVYIVHLSCAEALQVCREARDRNLHVYVETRPLYLHFSKEKYLEANGPLYVGQPPLRDRSDISALWQGLTEGSIQVVATDHAPWTMAQKLDPALSITNLRPGVNNLQVMLPMLFSAGVIKERLTLEQFVAVTSTNAARIFGLYPRKGTIAVGSDADLVLWDPNMNREIKDEDQFSKAGFSIYSGTTITGWPILTIRRGEVVFENGIVTAKPGSGNLIRRDKWQPVDQGGK
jgi:dihydropyrimidinase